MVHFGKDILTNQVPGWEEYYLGYKALKQRIKYYCERVRSESPTEDECHEIVKTFSDLLDFQVEKIVLFLIEKQGKLAVRLQRLRKQREDVVREMLEAEESGMDEPPPSPAYVPWRMMDEYSPAVRIATLTHPLAWDSFKVKSKNSTKILVVKNSTRQVGLDLLQLLQFVELNAMGIRKILKKFDKRLGFHHIGNHYIISRSNHPYSQLQQVFRQVGLGAMVATISRNLAELQNDNFETSSTNSALCVFRHATLPTQVLEEEPVIQTIVDIMHRLTHEVSIQTFVANELLLPTPKEEISGMLMKQEDAHFMSIQLNLFNTFLYMVNYYIVVPSSDDYAKLLHAPATVCGVIIGSMPLAALVSALVYSWWSNFSYKAPLLFSTLILMAGNLLYALALYFDSIWLLLIGRFLCGLGGARAINRRYISDHVPVKQLTSASAAFVSASALGMAVGPALAGLLDKFNFKIYGAPVNFVTAPGWLMCLGWGLYFVLVLLFFKEPDRKTMFTAPISRRNSEKSLRSSPSNIFLNAPLLIGSPKRTSSLGSSYSNGNGNGHHIDDLEGETDYSEYGDDKAVETLGELVRELTLPVKILLWIYFMLKFASELLISESSVLTEHYFNWQTSHVAVFLSLLGLTVLPISAVVGNYISNIYEDRLVVLWSQIITGVGVLAIICYCPYVNYTTYQYVAAAVLIFVSTNVLEGVNMSLLSKVMSPRLSRGVFNCGLLSTEAGTLARALADGLITVAGKEGVHNLINLTMIPTFFIVIFTTLYTWIGYYSLY